MKLLFLIVYIKCHCYFLHKIQFLQCAMYTDSKIDQEVENLIGKASNISQFPKQIQIGLHIDFGSFLTAWQVKLQIVHQSPFSIFYKVKTKSTYFNYFKCQFILNIIIIYISCILSAHDINIDMTLHSPKIINKLKKYFACTYLK